MRISKLEVPYPPRKWPLHCSIKHQEDTQNMWNLIKRIFFFRVGQNATRGMARAVGLGRFGLLLGLIGGLRYMRRNV